MGASSETAKVDKGAKAKEASDKEPISRPIEGIKKITIKLNQAPRNEPVKLGRQEAANMERWALRTKEIQIDTDKKIASQKEVTDNTVATRTNESNGNNLAQSEGGKAEESESLKVSLMDPIIPKPAQIIELSHRTESVVKTSAGEPICTVCMRKFPNMENLRLHEKASALHKQNLAKAKELMKADGDTLLELQSKPIPIDSAGIDRTTMQAPKQLYVDRARKRRDLHGDFSMPPPRPMVPASFSSESVIIAPEANLAEHNVGNQLFRKMLTKSTSKDSPKSINMNRIGDHYSSGRPSSLADSIRKDWVRIETLAQATGIRQRTGKLSFNGAGLGSLPQI